MRPPSWIEASIGELCGSAAQREPGPSERFRYIDIGSIDRQRKVISNAEELIGEGAPSRARRIVCAGDVLVSMTRPNLNAVALVPEELDGQIASTGLEVLRPLGVDARWIYHACRSERFVETMTELVQGALYPAVKAADVRSFMLPLAPLPEQRRIADKLDALLARVDACRDRLERVPALLARFRQAVLHAATSGRLSADWRTGGIESWAHERAADVCAKVQSGGTPREGFTAKGVPFLKVFNLVDQRVDFDYKPQFISPEVHRSTMSKSVAHPGDVLMNIVGPPLGKVAVVPDSHPQWNINQAITLFRPSERITTGWLYCLLRAGHNIEAIVHETRGSAGQVNISLTQCREFVFPVPPLDEQAEIVRRVERLFAFADALDARVAAARAKVERLTPALLAKAFRGELVPQDPADEPASALLARIAAGRASPSDKSRTHRKSRARDSAR